MKVETKKSLKVGEKAFTAPVLVYENYAEMLKAAGSEQVIVDLMNGWLHAHGSAASLRDLVMECVEEASGVKPTVTTAKKDGKDVKTVEDALPYVTRVITSKPEAFDKAQALLNKKATGYTYKDAAGIEQKVEALAVDVTRSPRGSGGPKELAQKWKDIALSFINGAINPKTNKPRSVASFNEALKEEGLPAFVLDKTVAKDDPKNVETLGRLCKAWSDARASM